MLTLENGGTMTTTSDASGHWVLSGVPSGRVKILVSSQGFQSANLHTQYDAGRPSRYDARLNVGTVSETVEVTAEAPLIETTDQYQRSRPQKERPR